MIPGFRIRAILEQFEELDPRLFMDANEVTIGRITPELLRSHPQNEIWGEGGDKLEIRDYVQLCLPDGTPIGSMGTQSIAERLTGDTGNIGLIVISHEETRVRQGRETVTKTVTIYKAPKNWTVQEWAEEQFRREREILATQIAAIDTEGGR